MLMIQQLPPQVYTSAKYTTRAFFKRKRAQFGKDITMKAIRINEIGGPEVMQLEEVETPTPQEGEVLIKVAAAGVTQADLAQRQGTYLTRTRTPMILGMEVAGTVVALGPGVS